jgi:tetratricopeptide (TPR) repeat protein
MPSSTHARDVQVGRRYYEQLVARQQAATRKATASSSSVASRHLNRHATPHEKAKAWYHRTYVLNSSSSAPSPARSVGARARNNSRGSPSVRTPRRNPDAFESRMDVGVPRPSPSSNGIPPTNDIGIRQCRNGVAQKPKAPLKPNSGSAADVEAPLPRNGIYASPAPGASNEIHATQQNLDVSGKLSFITSKQNEAKSDFLSGDYRSSIMACTAAIKRYMQAPMLQPSDLLAVLLSYRAAGLLMVGAYDAAVADCQQALHAVSPLHVNEAVSNDGGPLLKIKLYTRLGRAHLKLGDYAAATDALNDAITTAAGALAFSKSNHTPEAYEQNKVILNRMVTAATLSQSDAKRLRDACDQVALSSLIHLLYPNDRDKYAESLGHINMALSIASGSVRLIENKVSILVQLKRWREVAGFCERLAALRVGMDEIFIEDLQAKNPFPGVPPAQVLKADFFGGLHDEDPGTRDLKLNSRAAAEAVCRMPYNLTSTYIRAMRLEERYPAAYSALRALEDLFGRQVASPSTFAWLSSERNKLDRTKEVRELGDEFFRLQHFEKAAAKYSECMKIDSDGKSGAVDNLNAGGRLHAILHCNRAACLMALRLFHGAVDECTNALKIHSRYMKAILRRARCYARLQQTQESIADYQRWLDVVEEASRASYSPPSPCLFDNPKDIKPSEVALTKKELDDLHKARRRADATARDEARAQRERQRSSEQYRRSTSTGNARDRRDERYNEQNWGSRRWDPYTNRGPRSSRNPQPSGQDNFYGSHSQGHSRQHQFASPRSNQANHYAILHLTPHASVDDINRAFRKLALKYHPDKNKDEGAVDNFRRGKLAQEVLTDPIKRRQYDHELRLGRPY